MSRAGSVPVIWLIFSPVFVRERANPATLDGCRRDVKSGSLCGLGQTATNPVLTTIEFFRDEYEAHINEKRCPAAVCKALITYRIEADKCIGCERCKIACPVNVITGNKKEAHVIDPSGCIRCSMCKDVCPVDAVLVS